MVNEPYCCHVFHRDWSLKPNGQQWLDLVYSDWWTNTGGTTDGQGAYQARGFHGEYGIEVSYQGRQQFVSATLAPGGVTVAVTV